MSDQIHINRDRDGLHIHIGGVSSALGFMEVLVNSKFQPGLSWKGLLNPHVNTMIEALVLMIREDARFQSFPEDPDLIGRRKEEILLQIREYLDGGGVGDEEYLLERALIPYGEVARSI